MVGERTHRGVRFELSSLQGDVRSNRFIPPTVGESLPIWYPLESGDGVRDKERG